jgi:hypothetical protein
LLEVRLRIFIENLKPSRSPCPPEVNPDATTVCKRVADPMSARTVFDHHDDSAAVIEISDRNAVPLPGPTADGLDDEGIPAVVGRARDSSKKRKVGDRVGDAYNGPRKLHRLASDLAVQPVIYRPAFVDINSAKAACKVRAVPVLSPRLCLFCV